MSASKSLAASLSGSAWTSLFTISVARRYLPSSCSSRPRARILSKPPIMSTYSGAESLGDSGMRVVGLQSQNPKVTLDNATAVMLRRPVIAPAEPFVLRPFGTS